MSSSKQLCHNSLSKIPSPYQENNTLDCHPIDASYQEPSETACL